MSVRDGLLGLALAVAVAVAVAGAGAAGASPPADPLVEGREPGPVASEFHGAEPATFGYAAGPRAASAAPLPGFGLWAAGVVWDVLLDRMTVPLGVVRAGPTEVWD